MIVLLVGLPGTGKSAIARALVSRVPGAVVLSKDIIRPALFPAERIEYSAEQDDFVLRLMLETAAFIFKGDAPACVILDGRTFSKEYQRETVLSAALALGQPVRVVEVVASANVAKERLRADAESGRHPARNRDETLYEQVRAHFELVPEPKLVVDTSVGSPEQAVEQVLRYLGDRRKS